MQNGSNWNFELGVVEGDFFFVEFFSKKIKNYDFCVRLIRTLITTKNIETVLLLYHAGTNDLIAIFSNLFRTLLFQINFLKAPHSLSSKHVYFIFVLHSGCAYAM